MKCYQCGAEVESGSSLCSKCGSPQGFSKELIRDAEQGKQEAITELYNRTYNNVYQSVRMLIKDEDTALDIIQDAYIRGFQHLDQLEDPNHFRAWIKRIGINTAKNYLKKKTPVLFSEMEGSGEDESPELQFVDEREEHLPEVSMDRKETTRLIDEILDDLSDEQRLVVTLYFYEEMNAREIAEELGVSEDTVRSRLRYAKKKIETKVLDIEKRDGIRLHSLAPIPFLLLLFRSQKAYAAELPDAAVLREVQKATVKTVSSATKITGAKTAESEAAGAKTAGGETTGKVIGETVAKAGAKAAVGTAAKSISAKVIAGVVAASVIVGGGAYAVHQKNSPDTAVVQTESYSETESLTQGESRETADTKEMAETKETVETKETTAPESETAETAAESRPTAKSDSENLAQVMEVYGRENLSVNIDVNPAAISADRTYFEFPAQIIVTACYDSNPLEGKSPGDVIEIPTSKVTGATAKYTIQEGDTAYQNEYGKWEIVGEYTTATSVPGMEVYNGLLRIYNRPEGQVHIYADGGYATQTLFDVNPRNLVSGVVGENAQVGIKEGYGTGESNYVEGLGYLPAMYDLGGYIVDLDENGYIINITQQWYP